MIISMQVYGQAENVNPEMTEYADEYLTKLTDLKKFNGSVLLKKKDQIILKKAYNMSDDAPSTLNVRVDSQFDLRSVAKLFAKAAILKLEKEGKIDRNEFVDTYISDIPRGQKITINHLLDHSSGFPREFSNADLEFVKMDPESVLELIKQESLEFEPGTKSQYSNVAFQLLYYLIGQQSGMSYQKYMRTAFFDPLKMTHSGSHFDENFLNKNRYAYGHYLSEHDRIECECEFPNEDMRMGHLYSTVEDLDIFLGHIGTAEYKDLVSDGKTTHAGGTKGKRAYVELDVKHDYEIIFLSNYDEIPFEKIVKDLRSILMNEHVIMPLEIFRQSIEVDPDILAKYQGTYDLEDAGHLVLSIRLENNQLFVYQKGQNNGVLYPENENTFFADPKSEESVVFKKDDNGNIYMLLDFQGVRWKGTRISN